MREPVMAILAAVMVAVFGGCGGGGKGAATTPEGTVKAMLAAVQAGDAMGVAVLYDYVEDAKRQNENWDDIPKGQQGLILKEEAKRNASSLEASLTAMKSTYQEAKVGTAQVNGETATVTVATAPGSQTLKLVQRGARWYLAGGVVE